MGGYNLMHAHPNYLICMHFTEYGTLIVYLGIMEGLRLVRLIVAGHSQTMNADTTTFLSKHQC